MTTPFTLAALPRAMKVVLTLFLAMIGVGYLMALGNLYHRFEDADGRPGLTMDDLRAAFHGIAAREEPAAAAASQPAVPKSRMLQMVEPGGKMRKNAMKGGEPAVRALEAWLKRGALEAEFHTESLGSAGDPSAESVIERRCLSCHNAEDGEQDDAPYGADPYEVDYRMVYVYAAPGTAKVGAAGEALGPMSEAHLFLITHAHMLSIPVFTLLVTGLFWLSGGGGVVKGVVAAVPMTALAVDFASWWLARLAEAFVYVIAAAGAVYALGLAWQLLAVAIGLWRPGGRRQRSEPPAPAR